MTRSYAVVWAGREGEASGKLEPGAEGFALSGRAESLTVPFSSVAAAFIERARAERLRGMPVLVLRQRCGDVIRIACLDGAGALLELADLVPVS